MAGGAWRKQDQFALARASMEEAAALSQQIGDVRMRGNSLSMRMSNVLPAMGEYECVEVVGEEALAIFRELGAPLDVGLILINLGLTLFCSQRDQKRGSALAEQGLELLRELKGTTPIRIALNFLGLIRRHQGRQDEARRLLEEGLALGHGQPGPIDLFQSQTELARLLVQQGQLAEARALYEGHRALLPTSYGKSLIAYYLEGRAALEAALGAPETAARLWGAAEALREAIGAPMYPVDHAEYAPLIMAARTALGETTIAAAWAEGRKLTPEQALSAAV